MAIQQQIEARLAQAPVVPLIQADDPDVAVKTAEALKAGGLSVLECVLRTDSAVECMAQIVRSVDDVIVGAGTVLTVDQASAVLGKGAQFIVSPGLVDDVAQLCIDRKVPFYGGTMTAGEVQRAHCLGLETVKFFPANLAGGTPMLKALGSVFRKMRFMPTGGISAANLSEYLALPQVIACGGSWLTPADAIAAGDYSSITRLAQEAVEIATRSRK